MRQSKEIYALNHSLWNLVRNAARNNFCTDTPAFELPEDSLDAITQLNDECLLRLCSATLVLFAPKNKGALAFKDAIPSEGASSSPSRDVDAFTQLWWLSLGKMAASDPRMSAQAFGIPVQFAREVASMSMQHVWQLSTARHIKFSLRFNPMYIRPILHEKHVPAHLFLKIHQQALSHSV